MIQQFFLRLAKHLPLIDLIFEALDSGVSEETLVKTIKTTMTEIVRAELSEELDRSPTIPAPKA